MTVHAAFKGIVGEALQPEGFRYCAPLNAFVKLLNEDLLAFIGVKSAPTWNRGEKGVQFVAGIISVYSPSMDKKSILCMGHDFNTFVPKEEVRVSFAYDADTLEESMSTGAAELKKRLLPIFAQVVDLRSYIDYLKRYAIDLLWDCDTFQGESLVLIQADHRDDLQQYFREKLEETNAQIDDGRVGAGYTKEDSYRDTFHGIIERLVVPRDRVYADKHLYQQALAEATRRKRENRKALAAYRILQS